MLSSFIDQSPVSSSNLPLQHVNQLHGQQNNNLNESNPFITGNREQNNDSNIINIYHEQKQNENNMNHEQDDNSIDHEQNENKTHHEQQENNSKNTRLAEQEEDDHSANSFFSPAAWRTRSKSKTQNKTFHQKSLFFIYHKLVIHLFVYF